MKTSELIYIGIKGSVVALDRATGQQIWVTHLKGAGFVNIVLQPGAILASVQGEVFCLDPLTGHHRWHNPLRGFGLGIATIATEDALPNASAVALAEKRHQDEQAAAAS